MGILACIGSMVGAGGAMWGPRALFGSSEVGAWYDPSDFSTMFQDSAGTTPVTAVEQPVGLILDKSQGLVLGSELVTNGTFDDATGWTLGNWTVSGGTLNSSAVGEPAGNATYSGGVSTTSGVMHKITFTVVTKTSTQIYFALGSTNYVILPAGTGTFTTYLPTTGTSGVLTIRKGDVSAQISIDNISVKELPGYHATQATSAARPVTAANSLDLDGVDDRIVTTVGGAASTAFMLGIAFNAAGAGTARTLWSDRGTNTGLQLAINTSNQIEFSGGDGAAYTTVTGDTVTAGTAYVVTAYYDGAKLAVQVNSAAEDSTAFSTLSAGAAAVSIGATTTPSNYFNDKIYGLVWTKNDAGTEAERAALRSYLASKGGVTL